ncbi:MAG: methyltransferase domain-containing protein [Thermoleophilia bacterium]
MADGPPDLGGFADVDRSGSPEALAGYLDAVRDVAAVGEWKRRSFDLLDPRPGAVLLDLGCGTGEDVLALADRVAPGGRALGIDRSATMIVEARRRAGGRSDVGFLQGDALDLPLPDADVDGARAERVLLHVEDPADVIAEMMRVLRPGGRIVVAEPDWSTLVVDAPLPEAGRAIAVAAAGRFRSPFVGHTLRRLLRAAGAADVTVAARTLLIHDPDAAEGLFQFADAAARAVAEGHLDQATADAWRAGVRATGRSGDLLVAMTAFMAAGRRD